MSDTKVVYGSVLRAPASHTKRGREFAQRLLDSQDYRKWLKDRITAHTLDPGIERMLWSYAYGKPKTYIEVSTPEDDLTSLTLDQLKVRSERLTTALLQLGEGEETAEQEPRLVN